MSYVGGKAKASFLFGVLNSPRFDGWAYFEPCCGYCHVLRRVVNKLQGLEYAAEFAAGPLGMELGTGCKVSSVVPGGQADVCACTPSGA